MNKISKKIVSLVTMAAFALTLVPAAAFATPIGSDGIEANLKGGNQTIVLNSSDEATATIDIKVGDTALNDNTNELAIWAGTETSTMTGIKSVATSDETADTAVGWDNVYWLDNQAAGKTFAATVTFNKAGTYPLYVGNWVTGNADLSAVKSELIGTVTVLDSTDAAASASKLFADGSKTTVEGKVGGTTEISFDVNKAGGAQAAAPLNNPGESVYLWVENATTGKLESAVTFDSNKATQYGYVWEVKGDVRDAYSITATFQNDGEYRIYAGVAESGVINATDGNANTIKAAFDSDAYTVLSNGYVTAKISPATVITKDIMVDSVTSAHRTASSADTNNNRHEEFTIDDNVTPSNTKVYTVKGTAYVDAEQTIEAANEVLEVSADSGLNLGGLTDGTVTTNARGEFEFTFTMEDAASYDITITESNDDAKTVLTIVQDDVDAVDIAVAKDGGYVLAGTDRTYGSQVYGGGSALLSDAVQFSITDAYGRDAYGPGPIKDEAAANTTNHADSLTVVDQPKGGELTSDNFYLAWDEDAGVYTLEYKGAAKDLIAGEYQVRVALNNGGKQAVTVSFTAAEFGDVEDIVLDMNAAEKAWWDNSANNNAITAISDQVALGQWVNVTPKYVDANGLKVTIPNYNKLQVGINGDAVANRVINSGRIAFATPANTAANNDYVGSVITVKVNDPATNKYVEKELTVVKNYQAETVSVDPTQGAVGEANTVNVSVVDENGKVSAINGSLTATVVSQSDETATVTVKANPQVKNGKGSLYIESDKAGTADVRVVVEANNGELYAGTFTYTFGDEDPYAGRTVVMTIGSADYIINNKVVEGDAAPYIDSAWRTMVPVRVLAESFGADVDYTDGVVTIVDGDTTIVMNVGEDTYTINDEEQTMDTAPVIGAGDRTYVPVRFVAEGLGYEVTPLYDVENGTTASVAFQK